MNKIVKTLKEKTPNKDCQKALAGRSVLYPDVFTLPETNERCAVEINQKNISQKMREVLFLFQELFQEKQSLQSKKDLVDYTQLSSTKNVSELNWEEIVKLNEAYTSQQYTKNPGESSTLIEEKLTQLLQNSLLQNKYVGTVRSEVEKYRMCRDTIKKISALKNYRENVEQEILKRTSESDAQYSPQRLSAINTLEAQKLHAKQAIKELEKKLSPEQQGFLYAGKLLQYKKDREMYDFVLTPSRKEVVDHIVIGVKNGVKIMLKGTVGTGKTELAKFILKKISSTYSFINWQPSTNERQLFGRQVLKNDNGVPVSEDQLGVYLQAMVEGNGIVHEELNNAPPEVLMGLKPYWNLKAGDKIRIPGFGQNEFTLLPGFFEIFTANPNDARTKREQLDPAIDRMLTTKTIQYMDEQESRDVILSFFMNESGLLMLSKEDVEFIKRLCHAANVMQKCHVGITNPAHKDFLKSIGLDPEKGQTHLVYKFLDTGRLFKLFKGAQDAMAKGYTLEHFIANRICDELFSDIETSPEEIQCLKTLLQVCKVFPDAHFRGERGDIQIISPRYVQNVENPPSGYILPSELATHVLGVKLEDKNPFSSKNNESGKENTEVFLQKENAELQKELKKFDEEFVKEYENVSTSNIKEEYKIHLKKLYYENLCGIDTREVNVKREEFMSYAPGAVIIGLAGCSSDEAWSLRKKYYDQFLLNVFSDLEERIDNSTYFDFTTLEIPGWVFNFLCGLGGVESSYKNVYIEKIAIKLRNFLNRYKNIEKEMFNEFTSIVCISNAYIGSMCNDSEKLRKDCLKIFLTAQEKIRGENDHENMINAIATMNIELECKEIVAEKCDFEDVFQMACKICIGVNTMNARKLRKVLFEIVNKGLVHDGIDMFVETLVGLDTKEAESYRKDLPADLIGKARAGLHEKPRFDSDNYKQWGPVSTIGFGKEKAWKKDIFGEKSAKYIASFNGSYQTCAWRYFIQRPELLGTEFVEWPVIASIREDIEKSGYHLRQYPHVSEDQQKVIDSHIKMCVEVFSSHKNFEDYIDFAAGIENEKLDAVLEKLANTNNNYVKKIEILRGVRGSNTAFAWKLRWELFANMEKYYKNGNYEKMKDTAYALIQSVATIETMYAEHFRDNIDARITGGDVPFIDHHEYQMVKAEYSIGLHTVSAERLRANLLDDFNKTIEKFYNGEPNICIDEVFAPLAKSCIGVRTKLSMKIREKLVDFVIAYFDSGVEPKVMDAFMIHLTPIFWNIGTELNYLRKKLRSYMNDQEYAQTFVGVYNKNVPLKNVTFKKPKLKTLIYLSNILAGRTCKKSKEERKNLVQGKDLVTSQSNWFSGMHGSFPACIWKLQYQDRSNLTPINT